MMKHLLIPSLAALIVWMGCKSTPTGPSTGIAPSVVVFNRLPASGMQSVWRMRTDGSGRVMLASPAAVFSPSVGRTLVAQVLDSTSGLQMIRQFDTSGVPGTDVCPAVIDGAYLIRPTLSPDGHRVAAYGYVTEWGSDSGRIYVVNIDGTNGHWMPTNSAYESMPAFSPDGSMIAYFGSDRRFHIDGLEIARSVSVDSGVVAGNDFFSHIQWLPSGNAVWFEGAGQNGKTSIRRVNADGSGLTDIGASMPTVMFPELSPDGTRMLCVMGTTQADVGLYMANSDGSHPQRITSWDSTRMDFYYSWSKDGSKFLFTRVRSLNDVRPSTLYLGDAFTLGITQLADSVYDQAYFAR